MTMHYYNLGRLFYQNLIGLLLFLICFLLPLSAQADNIKADPSLLKQLKQITSDRADIAYHSKTGYVRFMGTDLQNPIPTGLPSDAAPEDAARAFLSTYGKLFGITNQRQELTVMREKTVDGNRSFVRFQQKHNGIPVLGGELNVQTDAGKNIVSANGKVLPGLSVDVTLKISAADAIEKAVAVVAKTHSIDASELSASSPELWIYNPIMLKPARDFNALVWRMDVTPNRLLPIRELVLVDAHTGIVALHFNQIPHAKNRLTYTANNTTSLPGNLVCNEANPNCTGGDTHAVAAHTYAGHTYDFYFTNHGRDSINNAGMNLISTVHYNTNYANAYWSGSQMVYGDAYGFPLADDVVAHELTHGVTDYESGLFYYYQSGAINESLSDVWGEFVDLSNGAGNDTPGVRWQIGEDVTGLGTLRSMNNPPAYGDPDRIGSPNYACDLNEGDAGGVHSNSGVNNKAAYLMVDGGTFNGYTVTALGITKSAKIYYEAQTNLLLSASDYNDLYNALQQACTNLIGTSGITSSDCQQVTSAVYAVEMNQQPSSCPANEASLCPTGQSPSNIFFDTLETTTSGNWVSGTISGLNRWYYPQNPNAITGFDATYATSGQYNFWGYNQPATANYYISMASNRLLPAGTSYLHFKHAHGFEDGTPLGGDNGIYYDGGVVEYSTNSGTSWTNAGSLFINNGYNGTISNLYGNPLGSQQAFVGESNGYYSSRLNLTSLAGQNVRFRFRIGTDSSADDYGWFIDDIRIYTCVTTTSPPTAPSALTATTASSNQINLAWIDNSTNETGFIIQRSSSSGGTYTQIATVGADITSYPNIGLSPNTTYYYRVIAYNASGNSLPSNVTSATTQLPPPSNLTATAVSTSQINLTWTDNSTTETGFRIERSSSSVGPFSEIAIVSLNVTTYSNAGLSAGTTYYYQVRSYNANGNSSPSNLASATTQSSSSNGGGGDGGGGGGGGCGVIDDNRNSQPPITGMILLLLPLAWLLLRKLAIKRA